MSETRQTQPQDPRARLRAAIAHFEHVLPGQAAIRDFVHHNTLHGFQHLPFPEAIAQAHRVTGSYGYLPAESFRGFYRDGRITQADLEQVIDADPALQGEDILFETASGTAVKRRDVILNALLHPISAVTGCQLNWQIEEGAALRAFQPDVEAASRERLLRTAHDQGSPDESSAIEDLWRTCLHVLGHDHYLLHPEELLDLPPEKAEALLSQVITQEEDSGTGQLLMDRLVDREADTLLDELFDQADGLPTLARLLQMMTGEDLMEAMRPLLVRHVGAFLDQGLAAWTPADRDRGFYHVWRESALHDMAWLFDDLPDWQDNIDALPDDPLDTIIIELRWLGLPEEHWDAYLERLALELPGWSGMFLWRHNRPGYAGLTGVRVDMADYLAVRLVLEHLFAQRLCRRVWMIEASFDVIRWYFRHNRAEFLVRYMVYNSHLPEYLVTLAQRLLNCSSQCGSDTTQWLHLAHMVITWRHSVASDRPGSFSVYDHGWRLFRLAQHLGLCGADLRGLDRAALHRVFACLDQLDVDQAGFLWLQAYENHYRDQLFNALVNNTGRGRWETRDSCPESQLVFCMDDREEGIRRHLEEHNPNIETLGAAGFFGVPINWRGLDDNEVTPLCPIVVIPSHEIREQADPGHAATATRHSARRRRRLAVKDLLHQETRRNLLASGLLILLAAPATLAVLAAKILAPLQTGRLAERLRREHDLEVPTRLTLTTQDDTPATPEHPRVGFTDAEQAERVHGFLRTIGLQSGFAPLVVMMGHGSGSQNNPHLAAYDCGACSGRHGGPNARVFAAMANRPEIRALLRERGCEIPADTWFLGAEHNTCDETITWYDTESLPESLAPAFEQLRRDLDVAVLGSAHERARRLASAPRNPTPQHALRHIAGRAFDFSQARPELGHATNAAALIGRRSVTRSAFFDRRVFLISYDPTRDPEGNVLEAILLAAGPVGAGINLEYYFSTVNNEQYGCGTKVTHNITGLFGVMEGTGSDLRTGLPKQMIEIHEAMRLQVVVEASIATLTRIYERQPPLQELIGNGWLLLSARDPQSGDIHVFKPGSGFIPWQGERSDLPTVARSPDWYRGHSQPLAPALIETGGKHG
jgi:uncharacterized protein YbcC (UPF0753/DUF2309 family)